MTFPFNKFNCFSNNNTVTHPQLIFNLFIDDLRGEVIVPPAKKLEDLIHLAELCVDLLQQNEEHYAEVSNFENFGEMFSVLYNLLVYNSIQYKYLINPFKLYN